MSRLLGFVRDLLIARGFGSGVFSDCFFVAFRIPNLLRSFVAEGALSSAFVPVFADAVHKGRDSARQTIRRISGFVLSITTVLTCVGILFAHEIVSAFAPGFRDNPNMMALCTELTRYMLPIILCVSLVAMLNGALNTLASYGAAAWAQVWMNVILIVGAVVALWQNEESGIRTLAISALVGSILQVVVQLPAVQRHQLSLVPVFTLGHEDVRKVMRLMLPAIVGATVYQLGIFLNTVLASMLSVGSVSWLYYADRLVQFPLGTFSIALGSVLLPALALHHSRGDSSSFDTSTFTALRFSSFFIMPVAAFLFALAEPITRIVFERGSFNETDTATTAAVVRMYAIGIWAVSSHSLFARVFIARKDTVTTTVVGSLALIVNFLVSLLLIGPLQRQEGLSSVLADFQVFLGSLFPTWNLGVSGLAFASSIAAFFSMFVLAFLAKSVLSSGWEDYASSSLKSLLATTLMVMAIHSLPLSASLNAWAELVWGAGVGALTWLACAALLRSRELSDLFRILQRRRNANL